MVFTHTSMALSYQYPIIYSGASSKSKADLIQKFAFPGQRPVDGDVTGCLDEATAPAAAEFWGTPPSAYKDKSGVRVREL